jgi:CheY-like chemotaxis protein
MSKISSIFLIDDDCDDREIFEAVLAEVDKTIKLNTASDGAEALEKLDTGTVNNVDLIFLDINMPRMDGIEFLERVKKNARFKNIPVVIYSTTNQDSFVEKTLGLGAICYITKVTSFEALSDALKKILDVF